MDANATDYSSTDTSEDVLDTLKKLVFRYSYTPDGGWLTEFRWREIPVEFRDLKHDICGMYSFGKIVLLTSGEAAPIFPIYVHELRHRWQWKKQPLRYLLGKIYRPLIENDADAEEYKAECWVQSQHA